MKYAERAKRYSQSPKGRAAARRCYLKRKAAGKTAWTSTPATKEKRNAYLSTPRGRFVSSRARAKVLGKEFSITEDQYYFLISMPCHYCDGKLSPKGVGLDRIDSAKGYTLENAVACCKKCNVLKGDSLSKDEMKAVVETLRRLRGQSRIWA